MQDFIVELYILGRVILLFEIPWRPIERQILLFMFDLPDIIHHHERIFIREQSPLEVFLMKLPMRRHVDILSIDEQIMLLVLWQISFQLHMDVPLLSVLQLPYNLGWRHQIELLILLPERQLLHRGYMMQLRLLLVSVPMGLPVQEAMSLCLCPVLMHEYDVRQDSIR